MTENTPDKSPAAVGLTPGTRIGKYEIIQRIGVGGQSVVYRGRDTLLDRIVAIKQISAHLGADERFVKRFRAEAKILAQLGGERSNIVAVYDLIEHELGLFIAMEHVEGHTLCEILGYQESALPVEVAIDILQHIGHGLQVAHASGVVHRDIKPGNVIVTRDHMAKITDFGVAAQAGQDDSLSLGTTKYMAPEVFSGATVDERVDIYSLGFLAYEMLTGRDYFRKVFDEVLRDKHTENVRWMKWHSDPDLAPPNLSEINPKVTRELGECVARMMAKDPRRRYASVGEVMADLTAIKETPLHVEPAPAEPRPPVAGGAFDELPTSMVPRKPLPTRTKVAVAATTVGVLVILGIVLAVVMGGRQRDRVREATAAYQDAKDTYTSAKKLYDQEGNVERAIMMFGEARKRFEQHSDRYGDLSRGTIHADTGALMSRAYQAMLESDHIGAEELFNKAKAKGVLAEGVVADFETALTTRDDAVDFLNQMAQAIADGDLDAAEAYQSQFGDLSGPPLDQDRRAQELARRLVEAEIAQTVRQALAAGDAAMANAEVSASADRAGKFQEALGHLDEAERGYAEAHNKAPGDPVVQQRLTMLRQARDYVKARADYIRTVIEGEPLGRQVKALQAVVAARPPSEALTDELATLQAEQAYQRAMALLESNRRQDLEAAREALAEAVAFKPLPKAVAALDEADNTIEHRRLVSRATRVTRNGKFAEAVALLEQAEDIRHDEKTAAQLSDARVALHMADGDGARKAKNWADALAHYEKARKVRLDDEDLSAQVDQRADLVGRQREYYAFLDEGRRLLAAADYRGAVSRLKKAELLAKTENMDVPADEAGQQKTLARYQWEVAKGKSAAAGGDVRSAAGFYRVAQNLINTAEVRQLLGELDKRAE